MRTWPASQAHVAGPSQIDGGHFQVADDLIFINQIRMKIGVMFGNPETTTGANARKFYASVRLHIRRIELIKEGQEAAAACA